MIPDTAKGVNSIIVPGIPRRWIVFLVKELESSDHFGLYRANPSDRVSAAIRGHSSS